MTPDQIRDALREIHADTGTARDVLDGGAGSDYARAEHVGRIAAHIAKAAAKLAGGEYRPDYNGHLNRETWAIAMHLSNTQDLYNDARELAAPRPDDHRISADDRLREYVVQLLASAIDYHEQPPGRAVRGDARLLASDLLCLPWVDWRDIAEGFAPDPEPGSDGIEGIYGVGEADEPPLHDLNGREADHYAGGKPADCPQCAP